MSSFLLLGAGTDASAGGGGGGSVAFDAKSTVATAVGATTITNSAMTVGSGSNRGLLAVLGFDSTAVPSGLGVTWNGVAMTQVASQADAGTAQTVVIFGLAAPASGNLSLVATWTGSQQCYLAGISFTGVNQTGGTTSFPNGIGATGAASPASVTVTSTANDICVATHEMTGSAWGAISDNTIVTSTTLTRNFAANYGTGAASKTLTAAYTGAGNFASCGVDVKAA